ncbi:MAG: stage II sporulation protein M [Burkholderiales bacterium]|jgi:uncharacterized membrane protein SpoIIM required for sporulation|nr:stage II sporulation protein M [Burkholderiales bacterium]
MTPLQFETAYRPIWDELEEALDRVEGAPRFRKKKPERWPDKTLPATKLAALYRTTCEHLALSRSRDYPSYITSGLEELTQRAHQVIYRRSDNSFARFAQLFLVEVPQAVRAHRLYMWTAALVFGLPLFIIGVLCYVDPGFVLSLQSVETVKNFDSMYGPSTEAIGRTRSAGTDWNMFGFYIMHNIGIAFRCFAGGVFFGLGSLFALAYNGAIIGSIAGYLTVRGYTENFYSFVITHGAFELTAIVISGAAGLALGHAMLAPRRLTRMQALKKAATEAVPLIYGATAMLFIAAALEAFWSSSRWVAPPVKYTVGGFFWVIIILYLGWQGRPRRPGAQSPIEAQVSHAG